jgi:hypothetical protein
MFLRAPCDLLRVGLHDHAVGSDERAGRLQLRHFFHFDEAHAAGRLQRQPGVVAEGGHFDALRLGRFDHERAGRVVTCRPSSVNVIGLLFSHACPCPKAIYFGALKLRAF